MPANKKYLTTSPWQRTLKVTAAILGGYLLTLSFYEFIMLFASKKHVVITMQFSVFLIWGTLMIIAFLAKNGWKIWGWYLLATAVFLSPFIYRSIAN